MVYNKWSGISEIKQIYINI